jgi:hypothetical protein
VKGRSIARALNDRLTEEGLKRIIARTSSYDLGYINELSPELLGRNIGAGPHIGAGPRRKVRLKMARRVAAKRAVPHENYWTRVKKEVHILLCTNNKKYANLRKLIKGKLSQTAIVTYLSAGIIQYLGGTVIIIAPLVATALLSFIELGANA